MRMLDRFFTVVDRSVFRLEQSRSSLLLFGALATLLLLQLWPARWIGNEEHYFPLGYRTFAPEEFPPFSAPFDASHARVVPLYLLGFAVHLLGYDSAHAVTRILMAILYAAGLAYFLSAVRLSVWDALLIIVVFLLADEQLLGAEWLFKGVEPKTLAYGLLFFAFGLALRRRWIAATIVGAAATYMHFLVGAFWTLMIVIQQWLETKQRRKLLLSLTAYGILTLPLAWIILRDQLAAETISVARLADKIYAERLVWHIAPFASPEEFWGWTPGIVATVALLLVLGAVKARHRAEAFAVGLLSRTALLGLAYLLLALVAAFVDRHTHALGKFYLFRPSALTLLLALTAIVALLSEHLADGGAAALKSLLVFALVAWFSWATVTTQVYRSRAQPTLPERRELVAAIVSHTAPGDVVLIEPVREFDPDYLSLHRLIPRPTLVSVKFMPTNPVDILRWRSYVEMRREIFVQGCAAPVPVPVRWLVTLRPKSAENLASCGPPVWRKGKVALIPVPHH
jgi:hypothetical protein